MTKRGFVISIAITISLVLILSSLNRIAKGNGIRAAVRSPSLERISGLISSIQRQIVDLINGLNFRSEDSENVKQISERFKKIGSKVALAIDKDTPSRIWRAIDNWFVEITDLHLASVFKGIVQAIIWFLELALALFKRLLLLSETP